MCILKAFKIKNVTLLLFLSLSPLSFAVDYSYYLETSYEDSSNLSQLVGGEEGQATFLGVGFELTSDTLKEWEFNVVGDFGVTEFSEDTLQREKNKNLQASGFYDSASSNLSVVGLVDVSQIPANRFQTQEVNNIRDQYAYALKPSYFFSLTSTDTINFEYTFVDFNLEDVPGIQLVQNTSNTTNNVLVNYEKRINETNTLSINFVSGDTDFDGPTGLATVDYEQNDIFLRWVVTGITNQLQIDLGNSKIEDELAREFDQFQKSFFFTRRINQNSSFGFNYSDGFSNALNNNQSTNTITINQQNNLTTAQSIEDFSFNYNFDNRLLSANLVFSDSTIQQVGTDNLEESKSISFSTAYLFSKILEDFGQSNIQFLYSKSKGSFNTTLSNLLSNEIVDYGFRFNFVYSSNFTISVDYSVREIEQLDLSLTALDFSSKGFLLSFNYSDRGKF